MESGLPDVKEATNELTSIALYDNVSKAYQVLVMDKKGIMQQQQTAKALVMPFRTEEELCLKFLEIYERINPDIITGWNCIPTNSPIWKRNEIINIGDINDGDVLYDSICNIIGPVSSKLQYKLILANGESLNSSYDHKFLVRIVDNEKYSNLQSNSNTFDEAYLTISEIQYKIKYSNVFAQVNINNNINTDLDISDDCLYTLGLIYTDGSISKLDNGVSIYNNDFSLICDVKKFLDTQKKIIRKTKFKQREYGYNYRLRTYLTDYNELTPNIDLIWDSSTQEKRLNVNGLSKLSKRQFWIFMSGVIDGDVHIFSDLNRGIGICNYIDDCKNFTELMRWNGVFSYTDKNTLIIPFNNNNSWLKEYLKLKISYKRENLLNHNIHEIKCSRSKNIRWRYDKSTDSYFVKIKSIEDTGNYVDMMDINCDNHQFKYKGVSTHNCDFFDIPFLYNRLKRILGEQHANRLSPIGEAFYSPYRSRWFFAGVSVLDYLTLYRVYNFNELPNYRLDTVGRLEINKGKVEYQGNLDELFNTDLEKFIDYNLVDVEIVVGLEDKLQFIDLCRGICHAGHVPYEDFVYSSKYLEGAMLTYLRRRGLVAPNKPADRREKMEALHATGAEKFIGAYVKDPIVGKYGWVYDLDLTSLYPSIIMSLNISPDSKFAKIKNLDWDMTKFISGKFTENVELQFTDGSEVNMSIDKFRLFLKDEPYTIASNGVLYKRPVQKIVGKILD